jgi:mannose-6-phosphate isomerase
MGSHPKNPSKHIDTGRTLLELFDQNKSLLSTQITAKYGDRLPFLFKVLSINKALSIQAHPNKSLAEQLHARDPKNYPDDNHKPEMAIAITPFEGLCGFRPLDEIAHFLEHLAPLRALVGEDAASSFVQAAKDEGASIDAKKKALQGAFGGLMSSSSSDIDREISTLVDQAKSKGSDFASGGVASTSGEKLSELVTRLHGEFGSDIGIFVLFFLNFVTLQPGEALFLVADDIHAYVSGDIIECMAASDNVVRAGLTPKFKDTDTLVSMLTYNFAPIEEQKMVPTEYPYATINRNGYSAGSTVDLYDPPIEEFSVVRTALKGGEGSKVTFEPLAGPSIIICTGGRGRISVGPKTEEFKEGHVFFVGATAECVLQAEGGKESEFVTFKAFCEIDDSDSKERL